LLYLNINAAVQFIALRIGFPDAGKGELSKNP